MNVVRIRILAASLAAIVAASPAWSIAQTRMAAAPTGPDVLVVGGTPAGVAAAVTAARLGERVVLVSEKPDLGGVLTDAMMDQWDLNTTPSGAPLQHGIFDEIYARLGDVFTPAKAAQTFAAMVTAEPSIAVVYEAQPIAVQTALEPAGRRVESVTFRLAFGATETVRAADVIDATDDADVAVLAGARFFTGRADSGIDERTQAVTEMFTVADVDWDALAASYDDARYGAGGGVLGRRAWGYAELMRSYRPAFDDIVVRDLNLGLLPDGDVSVNAIDVTGIDGTNAGQREFAKAQTQIEAPRLLAFLRTRLPGMRDARIGMFAPEVYVRETRHIIGIERLTTQDVWDGRIPSDSIGLASYPIDLHPVGPTDEPAYAPERHVYGIPFGALEPRGLTNLLLASPAISASHEASGSARIIPTTIEEGEADAYVLRYGVSSVSASPSASRWPIEAAALARTLGSRSFLATSLNSSRALGKRS